MNQAKILDDKYEDENMICFSSFLFIKMQLSGKAKAELRKVLIKKYGNKILDFSDVELNEIGTALLRLTALTLKRKAKLCAHSKDDSKK